MPTDFELAKELLVNVLRDMSRFAIHDDKSLREFGFSLAELATACGSVSDKGLVKQQESRGADKSGDLATVPAERYDELDRKYKLAIAERDKYRSDLEKTEKHLADVILPIIDLFTNKLKVRFPLDQDATVGPEPGQSRRRTTT